MRLFIAAAALLAIFTSSVSAQRLNATRDHGGIDDGRAWCRFQAYPDLRLDHALDGNNAAAQWDLLAKESNRTSQRYIDLLLVLTPGGGEHAVRSFVPLLGVRTEHESFPRAVASARVLVDGKDAAVPLRLEGTVRMEPGSKNTIRLIPQDDWATRLAALLFAGRTAQLDLLDETGALIRSYHWDVSGLRDAPQILDLAEWKCGDAVNRQR